MTTHIRRDICIHCQCAVTTTLTCHPEMRSARDILVALGFEVTSRWIDQHNGRLEASYTLEKLNADPDECGLLGEHDVADLVAADTVISFTSADGGGKGGRHVEHGLALGLGKRVIVCGPRENIFHTLPHVEHYPNWDRLVAALTTERIRHTHATRGALS